MSSEISAAVENDLDHDFAYSVSDKASLFAVSSETFLTDCLFLSPTSQTLSSSELGRGSGPVFSE